ncbi:uncharacterized protein LOC113272749 [Papaver somniferum]|uniref:uncharacterized protein LOC113272749 n=1 Tax=Papaver somniferum TaxID=3469 RepID=UPI000E6FFF5B|nr:uncharacterized protein LOC113272749 [Papaver somniferum]
MQTIYKKPWKLPLLPRIAQFLWKCIKDILQTRDKLVYAIQDEDYGCPRCAQTLETSSYTILHCNTSRTVWFVVLGIHIQQDVHLVDWLCSWFDKLTSHQVQQEEICKLAIVVWCIWTTRCDIVFKGRKIAVDAVVHRCKLEIELLKIKPPSTTPQPANGGIGLIVRDFAGYHRGSKCIYLVTAGSPEQVECKGLREALKWAQDNKLNKYVPKEKNKVAHLLANFTRVSCISSVWLLSPPENIQYQLQDDAKSVTS